MTDYPDLTPEEIIYEPDHVQPIRHKEFEGNRVVLFKKDRITGKPVWIKTSTHWFRRNDGNK